MPFSLININIGILYSMNYEYELLSAELKEISIN